MSSSDAESGAPAQRLSFEVEPGEKVSALLRTPADPTALYVLAHGAGAGMEHRFLGAISHELARRGIATFRYNFPYTERQRGRPDRKPLLHATVRAATAAAADALPGIPLLAGGKSMGGRMTSEAQAESPLPGVRGLVFLGFPLHAPGRPGTERAEHLDRVNVPTLFLQGTRDTLADVDLMRAVTERLGDRATLAIIDHADHSFKVLKRSGRTDGEVLRELGERIESWAAGAIRRG